ncbi:hypothetical protein HRG_004006 [Hirsutella rhossiliensis]|uniref:Uncharacterized protein n=1 Tax=Hirsutella rhossiliensis TaxID=111463 RepID=A0A9P8SLN4_9HYPO|nr:uncharacterized protein HRG_04006 [Hirsutella rhossiliensis]KAH0965990.1 hypothetical protein HRG_04006 [Hirsutella rhossiliensis]
MSPGDGQSNVDDKPVVPPLPWNVDLTLYELETIARLSSAIADTACVVKNTSRGRDTPLSIDIDIPDFQYYWTACGLFERNLVTIGYVQSWIAAIDERRRKLKAIMTALLRTILTDRQLSDIEINIAPGTEPAVNLIKEKIVSGTIPSLEEIMSAMRSQGGEARQWRDFLDHLGSGHQPSTVGDLGRLVYVFKAVKPALEHEHTVAAPNGNIRDAPGRTLIIQVDDIIEWRIFDRAKSFLEHYATQKPNYAEKALIVGLFPIHKIFVAGSSRSDLYHKDPGPQLCLNSEGAMIGPLDVIGMTYGIHMKEVLQRLRRREGFQ